MTTKKQYQRRVEFLTRLGELMEEYRADFGIDVDVDIDGSYLAEIEVYIDGWDNRCGEQRDSLSERGVERMRNCAAERLAEIETQKGN